MQARSGLNLLISTIKPNVPSSLQVTCNDQDYTDSGITFLYQADASVDKISLKSGLDPGGFGLFVTGENFVNSTSLACRVGGSNTEATFLLPSLVLCFVPRSALATTINIPEGDDGQHVTRGLGPREGDGSSPGVWLGPYDGDGTEIYVEVSMRE